MHSPTDTAVEKKPRKRKAPEQWLARIKKDARAFKHVSHAMKTQELWLVALRQLQLPHDIVANKISENDIEGLYTEAERFAHDSGKISISLIQWRFRIGFNVATRVMKKVKQGGIIQASMTLKNLFV